MRLSIDFDKVYLRPGFIDGRKGVNGLLDLIVNNMELNPCDSAIFLFCSKNRKLLKIIYWHKNGFWSFSKRLEKRDLWPWPKTSEEATELNEVQLNMLLQGIDFWKAHKEVHYDMVI